MTQQFDFSTMSVSERILLAEALWDSVYDETADLPLTEEARQELKRRLAEEDAGEVTYSSWEDVKARLLKK